MAQTHKSLFQLNLLCLIALKAFKSHIYMYTCIYIFNKQLPMDNVKEYDLLYHTEGK